MTRDVEIKTMTEDKKLLSISLEPDMWFEITDELRDRLNNMKRRIEDPQRQYQLCPPTADDERKYWYLKSIVALLETQLTE